MFSCHNTPIYKRENILQNRMEHFLKKISLVYLSIIILWIFDP